MIIEFRGFLSFLNQFSLNFTHTDYKSDFYFIKTLRNLKIGLDLTEKSAKITRHGYVM